jgi:hypothetical protein
MCGRDDKWMQYFSRKILKEKNPLETIGLDWGDNIKVDIKNRLWAIGLDSDASEQGSLAESV